MIEVEGPDGSVVEFPEGTSREVMAAAMQKKFGAPQAAPTDDSRLRGFAMGLTKPIDKLAELTMHIPGVPAVDRFLADVTGLPDTPTHNAMNEAIRQNNTRDGYQALGEFVGTTPVAALPVGEVAAATSKIAPAVGGAIRAADPLIKGAAGGVLLSDAKDAGGMAEDAFWSALFSKLGDTALRTASSVAKPYVSKGAEALRNAGVPLTLGQLAEQAGSSGGKIGQFVGSTVRGMEDRLSGLPIVGDVIKPAQRRGVEAYNKAVVNRALAPTGQKLPDDIPIGHDSIRYAGDKLSEGYNRVIPKLSATVDRPFVAGLQGVWNDMAALPDATQSQFKRIMDETFVNRAEGMTIKGQMAKEVESRLGEYIRAYSASTDGDQRLLGQALSKVRDEFRDMLARGNSDAAGEMAALNKGWAELVVAEKAAARQGNSAGIFTPKQYAAEARMADRSVRRRATARGTRPNQATTDAAADILPNNVPDSGSAGRIAAAGLGAGVVGIEPTTAAMLGLGTLPYTEMGQRLLNSLFVGQRGPAATGAANFFQSLRPYAPAASAALYSDE